MLVKLTVDGTEEAVLQALGLIFARPPLADVESIGNGIAQLLLKVDQIAMTVEERAAAFEQRLTRIDTNTTASAAAANVLKDIALQLKADLDQVLSDAGVPAATEDSILGRMDTIVDTTGALQVFLEQTAAGFRRPTPTPEPVPVVEPPQPEPLPAPQPDNGE